MGQMITGQTEVFFWTSPLKGHPFCVAPKNIAPLLLWGSRDRISAKVDTKNIEIPNRDSPLAIVTFLQEVPLQCFFLGGRSSWVTWETRSKLLFNVESESHKPLTSSTLKQVILPVSCTFCTLNVLPCSFFGECKDELIRGTRQNMCLF